MNIIKLSSWIIRRFKSRTDVVNITQTIIIIVISRRTSTIIIKVGTTRGSCESFVIAAVVVVKMWTRQGRRHRHCLQAKNAVMTLTSRCDRQHFWPEVVCWVVRISFKIKKTWKGVIICRFCWGRRNFLF